jgi:hypothetical protein
MTTLYVDNIAPNLQSKISAPNLTLPTGSVLQVVQGFKSDVQTGTFGTTWVDVSGLSASITPVSTTSKILVTIELKVANDNPTVVAARCLRNNTTNIGAGDAAGNRRTGFSQGYFNDAAFGNQSMPGVHHLGLNYLDSPASTSQQTYKVQIGGDSTSLTYYVNMTARDNNTSVADSRVSSTITLMEIAG